MTNRDRGLSLLIGCGLLFIAAVIIDAWWDGIAGIPTVLHVTVVLLLLLIITVLGIAGLGLIMLEKDE